MPAWLIVALPIAILIGAITLLYGVVWNGLGLLFKACATLAIAVIAWWLLAPILAELLGTGEKVAGGVLGVLAALAIGYELLDDLLSGSGGGE